MYRPPCAICNKPRPAVVLQVIIIPCKTRRWFTSTWKLYRRSMLASSAYLSEHSSAEIDLRDEYHGFYSLVVQTNKSRFLRSPLCVRVLFMGSGDVIFSVWHDLDSYLWCYRALLPIWEDEWTHTQNKRQAVKSAVEVWQPSSSSVRKEGWIAFGLDTLNCLLSICREVISHFFVVPLWSVPLPSHIYLWKLRRTSSHASPSRHVTWHSWRMSDLSTVCGLAQAQ
jgi:hypothetical protein